jgi:hypothetical protein
MAEMDFSKILINSVLIALFFVAFSAFVIQSAIDNGASETLKNDSKFNTTFTAMEDLLEGSQRTTQNQSVNQDESNPVAVFDFLAKSIVGSVKVFKSLIRDVYNLTFILSEDILGVDPIVPIVFTVIILIIMIFLGWRAWKRG